ncbi:alkaline phosphatase family protein [Neobacillus kokaensis]|uniref:Acid phosphatase n=1 Tax=Neobacillus kokaensis TaxID=2759023 RepID=A0ABQ3NBC7_9BACI|nr:alkaline phosphatase family protein [Neobacillus kokaensis]GHI01220.1 acid phosphatase [Neobacillus kokaensis]
MLKKWGILIILLFVILNACAPNHQPKKQNPSSPNTAAEEKSPKIDHIVIVVEENRSQEAIEGNKKALYINSLMKEGANFTNYYAIEHPSQPNYLDLFSGSNQGVTNDKVPKVKFSTDNLASELIAKNYTFVGFSEDLPSVGFDRESTGSGGYARKHNPWVNFTNVPKEANQPLTNFPKDFSKLPTVSFVIPALRNDMHDGSIKEADDWLRKYIDPYVQWAKNHNSLLIVTWDEDDYSQDNKIPTFFVGPMVKPGQYNEKLNHYNLLRTLEDLYGLKHLGESERVEPIKNIWK